MAKGRSWGEACRQKNSGPAGSPAMASTQGWSVRCRSQRGVPAGRVLDKNSLHTTNAGRSDPNCGSGRRENFPGEPAVKLALEMGPLVLFFFANAQFVKDS